MESQDASLADETRDYLKSMLHFLFDQGGEVEQAKTDMITAAANVGMTQEEFDSQVASVWNNLVDKALDDHVLTEEEEERLGTIRTTFGLAEFASCNTGLAKLVQGGTLRDLSSGKLPNRFSCNVPIPFKLKDGEALLWMFRDVKLIETRVHKSMVGGSTGINVRIAKGVYWRIGAFKAVPKVQEEVVQIDRGLVFLTNQQIAFAGDKENFRLPLATLGMMKPYSDGVQIQKSTNTGKPFFLIGLDGWFVYNVMQAS